MALPGNDQDLAFVTHMGPPIKDPAARKLVKHCVMQQVGRSRRKPGLNRRQAPLQYSLEVDNTFLYTSHGRSSSQRTFSYHLEQQQRSVNNDRQRPSYAMIEFAPEPSANLSENNSILDKEEEARDYIQHLMLPFDSFERHTVDGYGSKENVQRRLGSMARLGAGRFDPFARFPIELNHRERELVDTS